jgi:hypothetical protein
MTAPTNDAKSLIEMQLPITATVEITGSSDLLFHRWSNEAVAEKAAAAKASRTKKTDDLESYVYRNDAGRICIPGEYVRMAIIEAAKFKADPRSPRKTARDLYRAGIVSLTDLAPVAKTWDYEDRRRVVVQRNAVTRTRPALKAGWKASLQLLIILPEYIAASDLLETLSLAGRVIGIADFRPTYGRFNVSKFSIAE